VSEALIDNDTKSKIPDIFKQFIIPLFLGKVVISIGGFLLKNYQIVLTWGLIPIPWVP